MELRSQSQIKRCSIKEESESTVKEVCIERENPLHISIMIWKNEKPLSYVVFNRLTKNLSYITMCNVVKVFDIECTEVRILYNYEFEFEKNFNIDTIIDTIDLVSEVIKYIGSTYGKTAK